MTEKYFKEVGSKTDEFGKGHVKLFSGWDSNCCEEARIETVAKIASLSYGNEQAKHPEALYERLKKLKHESLFEFISSPVEKWRIVSSLRHSDIPYSNGDVYKDKIATFRIKTPIFVARQYMRHRGFSYLEISRRYVSNKKKPFEFWFPHGVQPETRKEIEEYYVNYYEYLISQGIRPEEARAVIPVGVYTEFYCQADKKTLENFFNLRLKDDAQKAIRDVAQNMKELLKEHQRPLYDSIFNS